MVITDRELRWTGRLGSVVAALSALGLVAMLVAAAPGADAAGESESAITISWNGDTSSAAAFQPQRSPESIHFGDFDDLKVTVSKTKNLTDEVVGVTVTGMPGPTRQLNLGTGPVTVGANFVQAMQCWGDPAAADFYQNCQFGAAGYAASPQQASTFTQLGPAGSPVTRGGTEVDVPFRSADGTMYSSLPIGLGQPPAGVTRVDQLFAPTTSNEQLGLVGNDRTATFGFETQSAATAPHLNCGGSTAGGSNRCWLVVVPRGEHASTPTEKCQLPGLGIPEEQVAQLGSPVNPDCDYWANRVVVPLDFQPVRSACAAGSQEVRLVGTELAASAMSSWQRQLCSSAGTAFTLNTVADATARDQLVAGGSTFVMTNRPATAEGLDEEGAQQLRDAAIVYAPTTVSAVSIAFIASKERQVVTDIKLSPRLIAKMLTQSYGALGGGAFYRNIDPVPGWNTNPLYLSRDPEFTALNPNVPANMDQGQLIVTGPSGSDAISQVWAYLQADNDARAFLAGDADPWGMRINPYFLPKGAANAQVPTMQENTSPDRLSTSLDPVPGAFTKVGLIKPDGSPLCLCDTPMDTIGKSDDTLMPRVIQLQLNQTLRYDSLQAWPYAENYHQAASLVFRADTGSKTEWDGSYFNGPTVTPGRYRANGLSFPWDTYLNGLIDSPTALHYQLNQAQLQLPNQPGVFARPDETGMSRAVASAVATSTPGVSVVDPAKVGAGAYPLTLITYSAVNLQKSTPELRASYANFLEYVATSGQVSGTGIGELPPGYLPLDAAAIERTKAIAQTVRTYVPPPVGGEDDLESFVDGEGFAESFGDAADVPVLAAPGSAAETVIAKTDVDPGGKTENVANPVALALGCTLLLGLAGALGSPVLMRRRAVL
ncbi:hypothetical protein [Aeromicrobium alkaliterrae]|uniref:PBP domain-containing protein n=1 Tax=Aeromicrobium alkaliterrae TaxID=302168 RepID=A0ABP4W069_9ACTN